MRVGDPPLEAAYALSGPVPAGTYGLVGDGIVTGDSATDVEVRFEVLWRAKGQAPPAGTPLATFQHRFVRDPANRFGAVRYDGQAAGAAAGAPAGDQLVLRVTAVGGSVGAMYILNGDGATAGGRIPRLDLPR